MGIRRGNFNLAEAIVIPFDSALQGQTGATGTIACAANTAAADGDTITIGTGLAAPVVYEYDKSANGVTAGRVNWPVGTTAASLATALAGLIATNQPQLTVTDDLAGNLTLVNKWPGTGGNVTITKTGTAVSAVTGMSGGASGETSATATRRMTALPRDARIDSVQMSLPAGFAADPTNFWVVSLNNGATVVASWSTRSVGSGGQGAITANTPVALVLSATDANLSLPAGTAPTVVITKNGTPVALPPFHLDVYAHLVS